MVCSQHPQDKMEPSKITSEKMKLGKKKNLRIQKTFTAYTPPNLSKSPRTQSHRSTNRAFYRMEGAGRLLQLVIFMQIIKKMLIFTVLLDTFYGLAVSFFCRCDSKNSITVEQMMFGSAMALLHCSPLLTFGRMRAIPSSSTDIRCLSVKELFHIKAFMEGAI